MKTKEIILMTLEEYKKKVWDCMKKRYPNIMAENERLMKLHEEDFPELMSWNCTPEKAVGIIHSGLY